MRELDAALEEAAAEMKMKWDHNKGWEGHLGVCVGDEKEHWAEREKEARAAWGVIRRLTRLPPRSKEQVVLGQLVPLLTHKAELHQHPTESVEKLVRE